MARLAELENSAFTFLSWRSNAWLRPSERGSLTADLRGLRPLAPVIRLTPERQRIIVNDFANVRFHVPAALHQPPSWASFTVCSFDVVDANAVRLNARVVLQHVHDHPRALVLILEVRRVNQYLFVGLGREVEVLFGIRWLRWRCFCSGRRSRPPSH